ncbi:unnamed protein product, partial [marine sediment metagenome]
LDAARRCDGGNPRSVTLTEVVAAVAQAAKSVPTTLLIDGNLPCEDITAALALAAASRGKINAGVYLPAEDEATLDGLAASRTRLFTPEELTECDAILVVGDAFATHPVISRAVHALRRRNGRTPLVVVDSLAGRTAIFATHPLVVRAGAESRILAVIAEKLGVGKLKPLQVKLEEAASEAGVGADELAAAADAIAGAKRLGVILRAEIGKAPNWRQIALLSGLIASAREGGVTACLTYGNALGGYRLAR